MGQITLRPSLTGDDTFLVHWCDQDTLAFGTLTEAEAIGIATEITPGAEMSPPQLVDQSNPPDAQGGLRFYQAEMDCHAANATALLASGFTADHEAEEKLASFAVDANQLERLRRQMREIHAQRCRDWQRRFQGDQ